MVLNILWSWQVKAAAYLLQWLMVIIKLGVDADSAFAHKGISVTMMKAVTAMALLTAEMVDSAIIVIMEAVIAVVITTVKMTTVKDTFLNLVTSVMTAEALMVESAMLVQLRY